MRKFWITAMVGICFTGVSSFGGEPTTIMTLGDSITAGGKGFTCYRQVLVPELKKQGATFEFIGPDKDATSAHAGYAGKNTEYLRSISESIYQKYPADIVMLHSGHNSFSKDLPVPGIVNDTEAIIKNIGEINPDVRILLAQVIPSGKLPKYSYIPELNRELESLAARLSKDGFHISLVNQADEFDWKIHTTRDKVHPNAAGAEKMADRYMAALFALSVKEDVNKSVDSTR